MSPEDEMATLRRFARQEIRLQIECETTAGSPIRAGLLELLKHCPDYQLAAVLARMQAADDGR